MKSLYADETFKYWKSSLFNEEYIKRDLKEKHKDIWNCDETDGFKHFLETIVEMANEIDGKEKVMKKWSETQTINDFIKHILNGLGWNDKCSKIQNPYLEETTFRVKNKNYRTDILIVDESKEKKFIHDSKGVERLY